MSRRSGLLALACVLLVGCRHEGESSPTDAGAESAPGGCRSNEIEVAGKCEAVGVPPDGCAKGFTWDNGGCTAVLPKDECAPGTMAIPGETSCHDVAPCGSDDFPDGLPAGALYVRAGATGGDGTLARPLGRIASAVAKATDGGTIAIAPGKYAEKLTIDKALALDGRCPSMVEVSGSIVFTKGGTVRRLAVTSPAGVDLVVSYTGTLSVDRVWLRGGDRGVSAGTVGMPPPEVDLRDSLIEDGAQIGVDIANGHATVQRAVIRNIRGDPGAVAFQVVSGSTDALATATLTDSLLSAEHYGVFLQDAKLTIDGVLVRLLPKKNATGLFVDFGGGRGELEARRTVVEGFALAGVEQRGGVVHLDRCTVRESVSLEGSQGYGIVEQTAARTLEVKSTLVEHATHSGVVFYASALVDHTWIREIRPFSGSYGMGVFTAAGITDQHIDLVDTLVSKCSTAGIVSYGVKVSGRGLVIRDTQVQPQDGKFGDGIALLPDDPFKLPKASSSGSFVDLTIERSTRAGLAAFGADFELGGSRLRCNRADMFAASFTIAGTSRKSTLTDRGGNTCGCEAPSPCSAATEELEPLPLPKL